MKFAEYKRLLYSDLYRVTGDSRARSLFTQVILGVGFKYIFWLRTCTYSKSNIVLKSLIYPIAKLVHRRLTYKFGIEISEDTNIGSGFYIGHFGGIVVNSKAVIGNNCNISHGVTLGQSNRGKRAGYPTLGNNVYIGPGAKVIGAVSIGDDVAIGANCVVTTDLPVGAVAVGVPSRIISFAGSDGYVEKTDY